MELSLNPSLNSSSLKDLTEILDPSLSSDCSVTIFTLLMALLVMFSLE